ncbi:hypothetical protein FOT19_23495 [Escherichia coli]|nr:hypothetical protein [Escherichia coli]
MEPRRHNGAYRVSGFFMRKALLHPNYGGACGGVVRLAGSSLCPVVPTLHVSPPNDWNLTVVSILNL